MMAIGAIRIERMLLMSINDSGIIYDRKRLLDLMNVNNDKT